MTHHAASAGICAVATVGALLAPVAGIMLSDYYLVRRRRLATDQLYPRGQFEYFRGVNPAAAIAHIAAVVPAVLVLTYSWLVALPVSVGVYWALMKWWILIRYPQRETSPSGASDDLATSIRSEWEFTVEESADNGQASGVATPSVPPERRPSGPRRRGV